MTNPWHPRGPNGAPGNPAHGPHAGQGAPQPPHGHAPAQGPAHGHGYGPHAGQAALPHPQAAYGGPSAPLPHGPHAQQPVPQAQAHPTPPPYARQPSPPYHRPEPPHVPDPTVILMRPRRPRGLVISISVLVTLGLVIGGVLALTSIEDQTAAESAPSPASGAGSDELAAASGPGASGPGAAGPGAAAAGAEAAGAAGEPAEPGAGDEPGTAPDDTDSADSAAGTAAATPEASGDEPGDPDTAALPGDSALAGDERSARPVRGQALAAQTGRAPSRPGRRGEEASSREPEPAWLALAIAPDGAAVTVDGDTYRGPALQRVGPLEAGTHTIRITAQGHEPLVHTVELAAGKTERLSLALAPTARGPGKVRIRSTPAGASVVIDGKVRGITPVDLDLSSGKTYELTLSHAGYDTWRTLIEPTAGKKLEVETTLMRRPGSDPVAAAQPEPGKKQRDITVPASMVGDASRGRALYDRCRDCHGSKSSVTPRSQTQRGWTRFLASRRHARHAELRSVFSVSELADVKAFLLENAADVDHGMAAGVR